LTDGNRGWPGSFSTTPSRCPTTPEHLTPALASLSRSPPPLNRSIYLASFLVLLKIASGKKQHLRQQQKLLYSQR
jgi:hypothetical protein